MTFVYADRVREKCTTSGEGTYMLSGAVDSFQTFLSGIGEGNTCTYAVEPLRGTDWEVGIGTVSGATLSRDVILASSNSGAAVDWDGRLMYVFHQYSAAMGQSSFVTVAAGATLPNERILAGAQNQVSVADGGAGSSVTVALTDDVVIPGTMLSGMSRQSDTWHAYGGFQNLDTTITINTVDVWEHITGGTAGLWEGLEADGMSMESDELVIDNTGDYVGALSLTLSSLQGKDYEFRVYNITQDEQCGYLIGCTTTGANNYANVSLPLYIEATAGDHLRMEVRNTTDATNVVMRSAVFYIAYLHD